MVLRKFIAALALVSLVSCATFDGRPTKVITLKQADKLAAAYPPDVTIQTLAAIPASDAAARKTYRDKVIAAYLVAIDAHYDQFVRELARSGKAAHLGLDGALLLLTGAGAMIQKAASDLSAAATAVGGIRSSFDRELFADKTLPILTTLMDSRRLAVRADILRDQAKTEDGYTLEAAFADLTRYEAAGTLDGALSDAAADAGARAREAQYDFSKAKDLCVVEATTDGKRRALMISLEQFEKDAEKASDPAVAVAQRASLQKAAQALGITATAAPTDRATAFALLGSIRDQVEAQCGDAGVDALRGKITTAGVTLK